MRAVKLGMLFAAAAVAAWGIGDTQAGIGEDEAVPNMMARRQAECRTQPYSMLITIRNIKDARGVLTLDLHGDDPATFLKKGSKIARIWVPAVKGQTEACVPVPGPGLYGVGLYQDKNVNFTFDKGLFGIPAEPYGVSNDPPIGFSAPSFEDSAVKVEGPLTPVRITLHN